MAAIDYKTATYNFDTNNSLDSENSNALILLEKVGTLKKNTTIPIGYIFDDAPDTFGWTFVEVLYGDNYTYTSEELKHINNALDQLTNWVKIERDGFDKVISAL